MELLLIIIICIIAGFTAGITSFGYAIIASIMLPIFLSVKDSAIVISISAMGTYFMIFRNIFFQSKPKLDWRMFIIPMLASTLGRFIGTNVYQYLSERVLLVILCIFMAVLNIYFLGFFNRIKIKPTNINGGIAGAVSGFFGGLNNVSGPPMVVYYNSVEKDKIKRTAYQQFVFTYGAIYNLIFHISNGNITNNILQKSILGLIGASFGAYFGYKFYVKLQSDRLTKLVKVFILIGSIILVGKAFI